MFGFLRDALRGHWLRPWDSALLRWRIETYWGIPAEEINRPVFVAFVREHWRELLRFLRWAKRMRART